MVNSPLTFIDWHKRYFFLDCSCTFLGLPHSNPNRPLEEIIDILDNDSAHELAKINLYPFATEGNDGGFLVFDGREEKENNEFPTRVYAASEELDGLSAIIFSSFSKLLECLTLFMKEIKNPRPF